MFVKAHWQSAWHPVALYGMHIEQSSTFILSGVASSPQNMLYSLGTHLLSGVHLHSPSNEASHPVAPTVAVLLLHMSHEGAKIKLPQ